jgi:hypothetical protein
VKFPSVPASSVAIAIGVDPYHLTHTADKIGYHPQMILAGRRINVLGFTFKKNCPDIRNTRVIDVIHALISYGAEVHVHDPACDPEEARHEHGLEFLPWNALPRADALVAVGIPIGVSPPIPAQSRVGKALTVLATRWPTSLAGARQIHRLVKHAPEFDDLVRRCGAVIRRRQHWPACHPPSSWNVPSGKRNRVSLIPFAHRG